MTETLRRRVRRLDLRVVLGLAALVLVVLAARQLLADEPRLTGASGVRPTTFVADLPAQGGDLCQDEVELPSGTGSVELLVGTYGASGPPLTATFRDAATREVLARGSVARGWTQGPLLVPLPGLDGDATGRLCVRAPRGTRLAFAGEPAGAPARVDGAPAPGRMSVLARSRTDQSIADLLPTLAQRIGRGNAAVVGPWTLWAIGLLLVAGVALGGWAVALTPREAAAHEHAVPRAARALVAAALAVGLAWALLTPPFQVPDETSHVAYVQYLSETGKLPVERPDVPPFSGEQRNVMGALSFARVIGRPLEHVPTTAADERYLRRVEGVKAPASGGNAATASANPPLYYLLEAPIFLATSGGSLLTQVLAMRLLSVLLMGGSVLFAVLFLREMLPGSPWTWTAGGLACAFLPILGSVGGGVNPDSLLFLAATALFFGVGRVLRCGLTTRRACLVGGALAAGLLTKPLFFALAPVAVAGLVLAALRQRRGSLRPLAAAAAVLVVPVAFVAVVGATAFDHPYFAVATAVADTQAGDTASGGSLARQASYMLQLFLPRLPFLTDQIAGAPIRDTWVNGFVGVFGWVDYGFGEDAKIRGTRIFLLLLALTAVALVRSRGAVRARWRLLVCCLIGLAAVPAAVAVVDYQATLSNGARFQQARYLLPLLALYGGLFALAAKAPGPRLGRLVLPVLWAAVALHTLAAMVLTVNRYYL